MDGRRTYKKETGIRITEQEGGKRPRYGAGEIDFDVYFDDAALVNKLAPCASLLSLEFGD